MQPFVQLWEETAQYAKDCAGFLKDSHHHLLECSSTLRYLERDYRCRNHMPYSSDSGAAPWRKLEAALRSFAAACPTDDMTAHTVRISEAFVELKSGLLDEEGSFDLYITTARTVHDDHRKNYRFLVEFKTRLLSYKNALEERHGAFLKAGANILQSRSRTLYAYGPRSSCRTCR